MNKSAREMFIDLGYEYREDKNYISIWDRDACCHRIVLCRMCEAEA